MISRIDDLLDHYEGLVHSTAGKVTQKVEEDYEDVCQVLRFRIWKAVLAFDSSRVKTTSKYSPEEQRDRFVFSCMTNAVTDILKKKRHNLLFIEDIAGDDKKHGGEFEQRNNNRRAKFEERYLCFEEIDDEPPLIPSTLTKTERSVLQLLYMGYKPAEIAGQIGVPRCEVTSATKAIRQKMADWSPGPLDRPLAVAA